MSIQRHILLDTETTGLDPIKGEHRLTEIGCLEMINRKLTGRTFHTYINPEREVDPVAAEITGLTWDILKKHPTFVEVVDGLIEFIGHSSETELIIHNAPFDLSFLNAELGRLNREHKPLETRYAVFDTLVLARRLHPGQKNNLDALCKRYNVDNTHRKYHGALLDAEILAKVYLRMTAGQSSLAFGTESGADEMLNPVMASSTNKPKGTHYPAIKRQGTIPVIKATQDECLAHEALYSGS